MREIDELKRDRETLIKTQEKRMEFLRKKSLEEKPVEKASSKATD